MIFEWYFHYVENDGRWCSMPILVYCRRGAREYSFQHFDVTLHCLQNE